MTHAAPLAALRSSLEREDQGLLTCVHCGFCLPACPTYTRLGDEADSPRGRLHLMRAVAEGRLDPASEAFATHLDRCLGCRACEPVCPAGVPYGALLEDARAVQRAHRRPSWTERLLPAAMADRLWRSLVLAGARVVRGLGLARFLALRIPAHPRTAPLRLALAMLAASAPARVLTAASRARKPHLAARSPEPSAAQSPGALSGRAPIPVVNLDGCVQQGLFARVNAATRRVLAHNGFEVQPWPGSGCCGALHAHTGDLEAARRLARGNIAAFAASGAEWVCANAAGCGAAMKAYGHLLADDPDWSGAAHDFSGRVRDASELLAGAGPRPGAPIELRVAWDPPCHLVHAQGGDAAARQVLAAIPGLELVEVANGSECCGGAGIHALTHAGIADRISDDKGIAVGATEAPLVATSNPGCMMQIGATLLLDRSAVHAVHPLELLDASYARLGGEAP